MNLREFADRPLLTALVSEAGRGAATRASARPHGGSGTIARDRPGMDDAEEDESPSAAHNPASAPAPASAQETGAADNSAPVTGGGGPDDPEDPRDPGDPGGPDPGDDDEPPHSDGGEPTARADQPISLARHLHTGISVKVADVAEAKIGIHSTEAEAPQLLNITVMILMSALAVGYAAYTATHAASLPGGTAAHLVIILAVPAAVLACAVFTITRHKAAAGRAPGTAQGRSAPTRPGAGA